MTEQGNGTNQGFEEPLASDLSQSSTQMDELEEEAETTGWEEPTETEAIGEAAEVEAEGISDVDEETITLFADIESALSQNLLKSGEEAALSVEDYDGIGNIQGVGINNADVGADLGVDPGTPVVTLYVAEPISMDQAKAVVVDAMGVSAASSDRTPVNVVVTGAIDAFTHRFRIRPAPGGVSIGHCKVTAGTLGCLARGRSGTRRNRLLLLSNNHVIANSNSARFGDPIIQPGRYDGGNCPTKDRIAILERFVPIRFGGPTNYVDCATGWCWPKLVRRELIYRSSGGLRLFRISPRVVRCARCMCVGKTGRTTQLTRGYVTDCSATLKVNYGRGRVALFRDQIVIRGVGGNFSAGGDSGSVVWSWDRYRTPVGLLFAGGGGYTIANKMTRVVSALGISLYT